jgi:hypothetical protein
MSEILRTCGVWFLVFFSISLGVLFLLYVVATRSTPVTQEYDPQPNISSDTVDLQLADLQGWFAGQPDGVQEEICNQWNIRLTAAESAELVEEFEELQHGSLKDKSLKDMFELSCPNIKPGTG